MSFTKVSELTSDEALALALVQFADKRFTAQELATFLSSMLSDRLTAGTFVVVRRIVDTALREGMLRRALEPRCVEWLMIPAFATELLSNVDLPIDLFTRRHRLDGERNAEASANAGPVMLQLLELIPPGRREFQQDLIFMKSVFSQWRDRGWLSSKQVEKIVQIGSRRGMFIAAQHYIGCAMDEWRQPFRDAEAHRIAVANARYREAKAATQAQQQQKQVRAATAAQNRAAALAHNRQVKVELHKMEREGRLDQLGELVAAVFPEATVSKPTKAAAYAGSGSKQLRVCIAALVFGEPPALVWKQSSQMSQPGTESEQWRTLLIHPAFEALGCRVDEQHPTEKKQAVDRLDDEPH